MASLVVADTAGKWPYMEDVTAGFMYLRLHGDEELNASGYTEPALDRWAERIRTWTAGKEPSDARKAVTGKAPAAHTRNVYCYFDNDIKVRAPFDADRLMQKLGMERPEKSLVFPDRAILEQIRLAPPMPARSWRASLAGRAPV